jgi:hypothetical protein
MDSSPILRANADWLNDLRSTGATREAALAHELRHTRPTECDCDEALRPFDPFAEGTLRGEDLARLMPPVQHHPDLCADCREEFDALMRAPAVQGRAA